MKESQKLALHWTWSWSSANFSFAYSKLYACAYPLHISYSLSPIDFSVRLRQKRKLFLTPVTIGFASCLLCVCETRRWREKEIKLNLLSFTKRTVMHTCFRASTKLADQENKEENQNTSKSMQCFVAQRGLIAFCFGLLRWSRQVIVIASVDDGSYELSRYDYDWDR